MKRMLTMGLFLIFSGVASSRAQGPVFAITPDESTVQFSVKASVAIGGKFDKWDTTLTFPSTPHHLF